MPSKVPERPFLPMGVTARRTDEPSISVAWATSLLRSLLETLTGHAARINFAMPLDGSETMIRPLPLATYTVATLPAAASWTGAVIFVSDGAAGTKFRGSDGTSWLSLG